MRKKTAWNLKGICIQMSIEYGGNKHESGVDIILDRKRAKTLKGWNCKREQFTLGGIRMKVVKV